MRAITKSMSSTGEICAASLQALHQSLQQPRARLDRREQQVLVVGVGAITVDAEPIERRDAHRDGEIAIRAVTDVSISGRDDSSARIFASISLALARSQKRRSTPIVQSSATVFLAVPPSIRPTLVVIPRARSFNPSIASTISAMARMALRPLSGLPPACAGHPRVRMTKAPTP